MSARLPSARIRGRGIADHGRRAVVRIKQAVHIGFVIVVGFGGFAAIAAVNVGGRPDRVHDASRRQEAERGDDARACPAPYECREAGQRGEQATAPIPFASPTLMAR